MQARRCAKKFGVLQVLLNKILHHHAKQVEIFAKLCYNMLTDIEVWLSLVERYVRVVEVAGSNPVTSTNGGDLPLWSQNKAVHTT